uniref:Uncharacterized protein n=1 Tax=Sus scrofa TaxID=9823 RepID=A0A4X1SIS1_PIG
MGHKLSGLEATLSSVLFWAGPADDVTTPQPLVLSCAFCHRRARWRAPVVPATREAEAGGSLEPRSSGLQCAMPIGCPH